jgi:hypothetical protein
MAFIASLRDVVSLNALFSMKLDPLAQGTEAPDFGAGTPAEDAGKSRRHSAPTDRNRGWNILIAVKV